MDALQVYAILNKKLGSVASGIDKIEANGDKLIFTTNEGKEITISIPGAQHISITQEEFDALPVSEQQREDVIYFITDAEGGVDNAIVITGKIDKTSTDLEVASAKAVYEALKTGGVGGVITEDITTNVTVGNMASGTNLTGLTLTEIMKMIATKTVNPTVSISNNAGTMPKEIGNTLNNIVFTATFNNAATATVKPTQIQFYEGSTLLDTQEYVAGKNSYTYTYTNSIVANKTITARLYYSDTAYSSANSALSFVFPTFYGYTTSVIPEATDIAAMSKVIKINKAYTWNGITATASRMVYAIPTSFGNLGSIKDGNNFEYLGSYSKTTMNITTSLGQTTSYNVYTLIDPVSVNGFKQVYA